VSPRSILYLEDVTVRFEGFRALDALCLQIDRGELRAVIGPNGAGKTTLMDVVTGKTRADAGEVYFDGRVDLRRLDEPAIARLGIGRKFQKPSVFDRLSVAENLLLALAGERGVLACLGSRRARRCRAEIDRLLGVARLEHRRDAEAGSLAHGQRQRLEIAMLLAQDPKLLLVDEPAAGMTEAETAATAELLREIAKARSVVVVEHDMAFVRRLGARVTVLHEGRVLAEGSLDHVAADERVREVYLGR